MIKKKMKTAIMILASVLALGSLGILTGETKACGPTATEIFHLRSECGGLGEKIRKQRQDEGGMPDASWQTWQTSHYDPSNNRCYVKISSELIFLGGPQKKPYESHGYELYDGQSHSVLALASYGRYSGPDPTTRDFEKGTDPTTGQEEKGRAAYLKAIQYITAKMGDDN
jgi:hypothetical protein